MNSLVASDREFTKTIFSMVALIILALLSALGIFLAAIGITTLEMVEASAMGLALHADSKSLAVFVYITLGATVIFAPTFLVGDLIASLPIAIIRGVGGILLLYFGVRLVKSSRRAVLNSRGKTVFEEKFTKGFAITAFSVGAIEAFEASIVLVGLLPNNFDPTVFGFAGGIAVVIISTYFLRNQVRKVKQALTKILVSALLLSFATFWFAEIILEPSDLFLIPLFAIYAIVVYQIANRPTPASSIRLASNNPT